MQPTFHVLTGEVIEGPYTAGQLRVLEERGTINGQTQIAREGEGEWLPLEIWREVIHGAPTHRGPVPGVKGPRGARRRTGTNGLVKVALVLAIAALVLMLSGWPEGSAGWMIGGGVLVVALLLWVAGAVRE
jgi:hypothetical protein